MRKPQHGSVFVGLVIGIVIGLAVALAVAVYVTKVPVPFMSKSTGRTAEQDAAETRKNQNWDPNAPLYGRNPARPVTPASGVAPVVPAASAPEAPAAQAAASAPAARAQDPLGDFAAARAGGASVDPFIYFVQAGAFRNAEDAESQRVKLSLMGIEARVIEREQSGRQVFRVRVGPFDRKDEADRSKERLEAGGIEAALVRVQR